jgi:hypothetical protein
MCDLKERCELLDAVDVVFFNGSVVYVTPEVGMEKSIVGRG